MFIIHFQTCKYTREIHNLLGMKYQCSLYIQRAIIVNEIQLTQYNTCIHSGKQNVYMENYKENDTCKV